MNASLSALSAPQTENNEQRCTIASISARKRYSSAILCRGANRNTKRNAFFCIPYRGEKSTYEQNWDIVRPHLESEKDRLEKSIDQAALDFFGSVDNILAMCPPNTKLSKVGGVLGQILLAIGAFRCILRAQKRRNDLMNTKNYKRSVAEAETLPIYHKWLLSELTILAGDDWIVDTLKGLWVPIEFTGHKDALML